MKLKITEGKVQRPIRFVAYGPEGIGKSTFASQFPAPLFIDVENGTSQLDVKRAPTPATWRDLLNTLDILIEDPGPFRTIVIDTADKAEQLLTEALLEENEVTTIEAIGGGYGKGYTALQERLYRDLLRRLDRLIGKGINVTILAHAQMRKFESPEDPPYDRWELKLSKKNSPLLKEWTDILMFTNYAVKVVEEKNKKVKAKGVAKRVMYFNHAPTHDAKNRFGLEDGQPLGFEPLKAIYDGITETVPERTMLTVDSPYEDIVEGDNILEDPRDVIIRRLSDEGIDALTFEAWCVATGRLAPGSHYTDLSGKTAEGMANNIEILLKQLKGEKK